MSEKFEELKNLLKEIYALRSSINLLLWDEATYMPPHAGDARSFQIGILNYIVHEKFTNPNIGRLLDHLKTFEESLPYDSDEASLIRVTRREYERAIKIPSSFLKKFSEHNSKTFNAWRKAKTEKNFKLVRDYLAKTVDLTRELAHFLSPWEQVADPLIDLTDPGLKVKDISPLFEKLKNHLLPLVKKYSSASPRSDFLKRYYPGQKQMEFCKKVAARLGFDFKRGSLDLTPHPFTIKLSVRDVRITTRINENYLLESIFSTIHETGHGLYDQNIKEDFEFTPLSGGAGSSLHESQSRLWENIVGRSLNFWQYFFPELKETFSDQLRDVDLYEFYRAINNVRPSAIRTDSDELTYNLHIIIRFNLEIKLLEGKLDVKDLPEEWNKAYAELLNVEIKNDAEGVLQDVHWFSGPAGGQFHCYTLGNILSVQFFNEALRSNGNIWEEIKRGNFANLLSWLRENIYKHGKKLTIHELLERINHMKIDVEPYIKYLNEKYSSIFHDVRF